jgi:hypothetical protein
MVPVSLELYLMHTLNLLHVGSSSTEYLEAITHREIGWIQAHADPKRMTETPWSYTSVK